MRIKLQWAFTMHYMKWALAHTVCIVFVYNACQWQVFTCFERFLNAIILDAIF